MSIIIADEDRDLRLCFSVMRQLRPHLELDEFITRVRRQQSQGYCLAVLLEDGQAAAVAGFRLSENLAWGRFLYIDDLVTDGASRSSGHGGRLLDWLRRHAIDEGCDELHLDSGVQRFGAHRFYLRHGMDITSHHFRLGLRDRSSSRPEEDRGG